MSAPAAPEGSPLTAAELLRRAHRHELEPLARALGVRPGALGRDALARVLHRGLRAAGSHELANLVLRRGEPPPWDAVLFEQARRVGLSADRSPAALERALVARAPPAPRRVHPAVAVALFIARPLLLVLGPLGGLLLLVWLGRPRQAILDAALRELVELRALVEGRVTIALVGPPSVGKDAALLALFGVDTGNVDPVAGSTREIRVYPQPGGLELVNTPGVGDVDPRLTESTREILDQADVTLFLVSAQGGVRQRERDELARVQARGRPVLVIVNKIDTLREPDRERLRADTRDKLGLADGDVIAAAFDPLPGLAAAPVGVAEVRAWIAARLGDRSPAWPDQPGPATQP